MIDAQLIFLIMVIYTSFIVYYINIQVNQLNVEISKSTKIQYFVVCTVLLSFLARFVEIPARLILIVVVVALLNIFITKNSYVFSMILSIYILFITNLSGSLAVIVYTKMANVSPNEFSTVSDYLFYHIISLFFSVIFVKFSKRKIADMEKTLWGVGTKIGAFAVISSIPILITLSILLPMFDIIASLPGQDELARKSMLLMFFLLLILALYLVMSVYLVILYSRNIEKSQLDTMTGALNKEVGIAFLEETMNRATVRNDHLVVSFVDVDNLKMVNDAFGHNEGDLLIKTIADTIQTKIRKTDKMIRFGGDEFIIVFREMNRDTAMEVLERINHRLREISETRAYHVGISYGLTEYVHHKYPTVNDFIGEADKNMYEFKIKQKQIRDWTGCYQQLEIPYDNVVTEETSS